MDAILVVNAGSSSVKFQIFESSAPDAPRRLLKGQVAELGGQSSGKDWHAGAIGAVLSVNFGRQRTIEPTGQDLGASRRATKPHLGHVNLGGCRPSRWRLARWVHAPSSCGFAVDWLDGPNLLGAH